MLKHDRGWVGLADAAHPSNWGCIYFEQHVPRNSWNGSVRSFSSKCVMSASIQWPLVKRGHQLSSPEGDNAISITRPCWSLGQLLSGCCVGKGGCIFQMKVWARHSNKFGLSVAKYDVFPQIYRFCLSYLNYLIIDWWCQKLLYIELLTYVL